MLDKVPLPKVWSLKFKVDWDMAIVRWLKKLKSKKE